MADIEGPVQSSVDDNFLFGMTSRPPDVPSPVWPKKSYARSGSVKSTKSLYFINPDTSGTMARDEEMTLDIYDIYSDDPANPKEQGGKIKRSEIIATGSQENFAYDTDMFTPQDANVSLQESTGITNHAQVSGLNGQVVQNGGVLVKQNTSESITSGSTVTTERVQTTVTHTNSQRSVQVNGVPKSGSGVASVVKSSKKSKAPGPPLKTASKFKGGFQIKGTGTKGNIERANSSGSLHDDVFKQTLSNTLERRIQKASETSTPGPPGRQESIPGFNFSPSSPIATKSPSRQSAVAVSAESKSASSDSRQQAQTVIDQLNTVPPDLTSGDKGNTSTKLPGSASLVIDSSEHKQVEGFVTSHSTTVTTDTNGNEASGKFVLKSTTGHVPAKDTSNYVSKTSESSNVTSEGQSASVSQNTKSTSATVTEKLISVKAHKTQTTEANVSTKTTKQIVTTSHKEIDSHNKKETKNVSTNKVLSKEIKSNLTNEGPGQFQMRYKEGDHTSSHKQKGAIEQNRLSSSSEVSNFDNWKSSQNGMDIESATDTDTVSISSTSTARSLLRDESFKAKISSLIGGGKKVDTSASAPSSLDRRKKKKVPTATLR